MNKKISCLIIDHDEESISQLRQILEKMENFIISEIVKETEKAEKLLNGNGKFDIILAEIDLPRKSLIDLLKNIGHKYNFIFVTKSAEHSIFAFDLGCIDYIVKPINEDRFFSALQKYFALNSFQQHKQNFKLFKSPDGSLLLDLNKIIYVVSNNRGTEIFTGQEIYFSTFPLKRIRDILGQKFIQIHRRYIVNPDYIIAKKYENGGRYILYLKEAQIKFLISGRSFASIVKKL